MAEGTRIDKYLWAIRVFKTRTDATDACKGGKVRLNGNDVKPSRTVACGDVINVRKGAILYSYKVVATIEKRVGAKLVPEGDFFPQKRSRHRQTYQKGPPPDGIALGFT